MRMQRTMDKVSLHQTDKESVKKIELVHSPDQDMDKPMKPSLTSSSSQPTKRPVTGARTAEHDRKWGTQAVSAGKWANVTTSTASKRSIDDSGASPTRQPQKVSKTGTGMEMDSVMPLGSLQEIPSELVKAAIKVLKGVDITEVFSPERVVMEAKKYGLSAGLSMDLTTGWDFTIKEHRQRARQHVRQQKPLLVIGSHTLFEASTTELGKIAEDRHEAAEGFRRSYPTYGVRGGTL